MQTEVTVWICGFCANKGTRTEMRDKYQICAHVCEYLQPYIYPSQKKEHAETLRRFYKTLTIVHEPETSMGWECGLCADNGIQKSIISIEQPELHACSHLEQYVLPSKVKEYTEEFQRFYDAIFMRTIAL